MTTGWRRRNRIYDAFADADKREAAMKAGFIGLGNVGAKLAGSLLRGDIDLAVHDINPNAAAGLVGRGARWRGSPRELAQDCDVIITCLPSPAICASVMEGEHGVLKARVRNFEQTGAVTFIYATLANDEPLTVLLARDQVIDVTLPTESLHLFAGPVERSLPLEKAAP